jgi:hypothetical protein
VRKIFSCYLLFFTVFLLVFLTFFSPLFAQVSNYQTINTPYCDFFFVENDRASVQRLADNSGVFVDAIISDVGVSFNGKIKVYIADRGEFHKLQPTSTVFPDTIVGVAYRRLSLIILKSPREISNPQVDLQKTFIHELTHILLASAFHADEGIPRWLNEGIALYESREWDLGRVSTMTRAVLTDSIIPLSALAHSFPDDPREMQLAYAQSFYLISFLITSFGRESFHTFIQSYSQTRQLEEALRKVYSMNLQELERDWHSYLKIRFSWIPIITSTTTLWFIITIIFIYGYMKKKQRVSVTLKQWEEEELE